MFGKPQFYGAATVGERGQIVLPADVRREFKIQAGEKLLVLGNPHFKGIMLIKAEVLGEVMKHINEEVTGMLEKMKE